MTRIRNLSAGRFHLVSHIEYQPETGFFYWTSDIRKRRMRGDVVHLNPVSGRDFSLIKYKKHKMRADVAAFWCMGLHLPDAYDIAYKNGDPSDLRWDNLYLGRAGRAGPTVEGEGWRVRFYGLDKWYASEEEADAIYKRQVDRYLEDMNAVRPTL